MAEGTEQYRERGLGLPRYAKSSLSVYQCKCHVRSMNGPIRPEHLFRYFPPAAFDFFAEKKLWFSALKALNDPFDALPRFDAMLEAQRQRAIGMEYAFLPPQANCDWQPFKKGMNQCSDAFLADGADAVSKKYRDIIDKDFRLVCFSEKPHDLLMWARYGKGHTGFVVQFDPSHQIFANDDFNQVQYPQTDERATIDQQDQSANDLWRILFRKSCQWAHEREWRLVKETSSLQEGQRSDQEKMRFMDLPIDSVLAVYIGWQMPANDSEKLLQPLKLPEWKDVKQFVMYPDPAKYAIKPVRWEEWLDRSKEFEKALDKIIPPFG